MSTFGRIGASIRHDIGRKLTALALALITWVIIDKMVVGKETIVLDVRAVGTRAEAWAGYGGRPAFYLIVPDDLQALPAERFWQAKLIPVVCLSLLTFRYPVNAYYTAARRAGENEQVEIPDPSVEHVAITRRDYIVRRQTLTAPQRALLEVL